MTLRSRQRPPLRLRPGPDDGVGVGAGELVAHVLAVDGRLGCRWPERVPVGLADALGGLREVLQFDGVVLRGVDRAYAAEARDVESVENDRVNFGEIGPVGKEDDPVELEYFAEAPEGTSATGQYRFGPALAETEEASVEFAGTDTNFVVGPST